MVTIMVVAVVPVLGRVTVPVVVIVFVFISIAGRNGR